MTHAGILLESTKSTDIAALIVRHSEHQFTR